nr:ComF family protein [uncultured Fusobacterium sp.]
MLRLKEAIRESLRFLLFDDTCSYCHSKLDREGYICSKCLEKFKKEAFLKNKDDFYYVYIYEKSIRQIISDYKLRNRKDLVRDLAFLIKKPIFQLIEREKIDIIIPVPISEEREIERGFNQIEYLLDCLDIKYKKIERVKNTKHMYALKDNKKREKNVEKAFKNNLNLENKNVLIVDDIVTSGATINSICEELKKDNKNINIKIFSIAIARHFIREWLRR